MKPEYKIKKTILLQMIANRDLIFGADLSVEEAIPLLNEESIDAEWESAEESGRTQDYLQEFRSGEEETTIGAPFSRHYEGDSVAAQMFDGYWVGWTYWHGEGKHGEPEAIDWIEYAYDLECKEEEKLVVVRTFSKKEVDKGQQV
jgi:hypothetical protein